MFLVFQYYNMLSPERNVFDFKSVLSLFDGRFLSLFDPMLFIPFVKCCLNTVCFVCMNKKWNL